MCESNEGTQFQRNYSLEELIEHDVVNVCRARSIKLNNRLCVRVVAIKRPELTSCISKQHQKVFRFAARNFFENFLLGVTIYYTGKNAIFNSVEKNASVGFSGGLLVEPWT